MRRAAIIMALCAACGSGTGGETVVFVKVSARPTIQPSTTLHVQVSNAGGSISQDFMLGGSSFPRTFTITPTGRTGDLSVVVSAIADDGEERGSVQGDATIAAGQRVDLDLVLEPDDFLVNQQIVNTQWISYSDDQAGRQIGLAPDRSFLISWENNCPLLRCDILARRFSADTTAAVNGTTMNDGDFIVNQTSEYTEASAIAASSTGYLVAWLFEPDMMSTLRDVKMTLLDGNAKHLAPSDVVVSSDPADEMFPSAIARADGSFGVVWERLRATPATGSEIHARLFTSSGSAGADFLVNAVTTGSLATPISLALPSGGFVVAWLDTPDGATATNVHARVFDATGAPTTPADLAITSFGGSTLTYGIHMAATQEGFLVGWQAYDASDATLGGSPLFVQRFDPNGMPLAPPTLVTAQTSTSGLSISAPTLAVHSDGTFAVAWSAGGNDGDLPGSAGVRLRMFLANGMPAGDSIIVNTTQTGDQTDPSIVPFGDDAFLVAWTDASMVPPDTDGSGVRARVVYPTTDVHDGSLGAHCGGANDAMCGTGFTCVADDSLCHEMCTTTCTNGGTCMSGVCLF
jgi:hypothetical protein